MLEARVGLEGPNGRFDLWRGSFQRDSTKISQLVFIIELLICDWWWPRKQAGWSWTGEEALVWVSHVSTPSYGNYEADYIHEQSIQSTHSIMRGIWEDYGASRARIHFTVSIITDKVLDASCGPTRKERYR